MSKAKFPKHLIETYGGARAFKAIKRRQLKVIEEAINELRYGCAYFPRGSYHVERLDAIVSTLKKQLSAKSWGR